MWNVVAGRVRAVLALNSKASWLALGIENLGGKHNGMNGAPVVFGITSKDTEFPHLTGIVQEYRVHSKESRFRTWNTPYEDPAIADTEIIEENCYGHKLNITSGSNRLVWAMRVSTYMQVGKDSYHEGCSGENRTRYRGGGSKTPWIVDFHNTTRQSAGAVMPAVDQTDVLGTTETDCAVTLSGKAIVSLLLALAILHSATVWKFIFHVAERLAYIVLHVRIRVGQMRQWHLFCLVLGSMLVQCHAWAKIWLWMLFSYCNELLDHLVHLVS